MKSLKIHCYSSYSYVHSACQQQKRIPCFQQAAVVSASFPCSRTPYMPSAPGRPFLSLLESYRSDSEARNFVIVGTIRMLKINAVQDISVLILAPIFFDSALPTDGYSFPCRRWADCSIFLGTFRGVHGTDHARFVGARLTMQKAALFDRTPTCSARD